MYLALKYSLSAALVVAVSELAKRSAPAGALLASLPLLSLLAMIWLYQETGNVEQVAALSGSIFWLVLPSLALFLVLPRLLRAGLSFYPSLALACAVTVAAYGAMWLLLRRLGVST